MCGPTVASDFGSQVHCRATMLAKGMGMRRHQLDGETWADTGIEVGPEAKQTRMALRPLVLLLSRHKALAM